MDLISLMIIALLGIVIFACICYIVVTLPVSKPYFSASFSKHKYALLTINKNGVLTIQPAKFKNGRAALSKATAKFIKTGLNGSYSIGNIRCDLVHNDVGAIIEDSTLGIFKELEKCGIRDIGELTQRANQAAMIKLGLLDKKEFSQYDIDRINTLSTYTMENLQLLAPAVRMLNVNDMLKNCKLDSQSLSADNEEAIALIARQYRTLLTGKKENEGGLDMKTVIIGGVVLIAVALGAAFFLM